MKFIHQISTPFQLVLGLSGAIFVALSNPSFALTVQPKAVDFAQQALEKFKRGDVKGAIAGYTQAIQADSGFTNAYNQRTPPQADGVWKQHLLPNLKIRIAVRPLRRRAAGNLPLLD